jgi:endonuclease G, mitochondrial
MSMSKWSGFSFSPGTIVAAILWLLSVPGSPQAQSAGIALPPQDEALFTASCVPPRKLLDRAFYHICYDPEARIPTWVGYDLTPELLRGAIARTDDFRADPELPPAERAELRDYAASGFDRGHMAPADVFKRSRAAMSASFLLSNMAPQTTKLNRGRWQRLEQDIRALVLSGVRTVVVTGSLFLDEGDLPVPPSRRINNRVAVPTHCFTALLHQDRDGQLSALGFKFPNIRGTIPGPSARYAASIDHIEGLLGADLFSFLDLETQALIEANPVVSDHFD